MNVYQHSLTLALEEGGEFLELVSVGQNRLKAFYNGQLYNSYLDLPMKARYAVVQSFRPFLREFDELAVRYGAEEAEQRMAWCLYGSIDRDIDINVMTNEHWYEMSSHCRRCQYEKPFCRQVLPHLSRRQQQCFLMMRNGLTDKEIAEIVGISPATVSKHFALALDKLRQLLGRPVTRQYVVSQLFEAGV